jgi:hypothetical protein
LLARRVANQSQYRRGRRRIGAAGNARLPFINDALASAAAIWESRLGGVVMSPEAYQSFIVLLIGFAVAGSLASFYQLVTERPLSFRLLNGGVRLVTFLAIPVLTFAAPFIIMRNTIRGRRLERRRFEFAMLATVLAGVWSMMSGTVVVAAFSALAQLFA